VTRPAPLVAALLLLAGCSSPAPDPAPSPAPAPSSAPPATVAPSESSSLGALASAAQSAATVVPSAPAGPVVGADISWPQCPPGLGIAHKESKGLPLPDDSAAYVVIGLTNGPGFHANPCLADQVTWARTRGLPVAAYSVISWAGVDATTTPYAAGRAQAEFNVASMKAAGLQVPVVWLDVEPVPYYDWPADTAANAQVVQGAAAAYVDAGYRIGVYSTPYLWQHVVGDLTLGVPEWRAAGQTSRAEALSRCGDDWSIQGGQAVLGQWVDGQRDKNVTCPGIDAELGRWFA
jgi:hypothetical protein